MDGQAGDAVEVGDGGEGAGFFAGLDDFLCVGELETFDLPETEAHGGAKLTPSGFGINHRGHRDHRGIHRRRIRIDFSFLCDVLGGLGVLCG